MILIGLMHGVYFRECCFFATFFRSNVMSLSILLQLVFQLKLSLSLTHTHTYYMCLYIEYFKPFT